MKWIINSIILSFLSICIVGCQEVGQEHLLPEEAPTPGGETDMPDSGSDMAMPVLPETSHKLANFVVDIDDADQENFAHSPETVITSPDNPYYSDFEENFSFPHIVTITYDGQMATVSPSLAQLTVTQKGAHVVISSSMEGVEFLLAGTSNDASFEVHSTELFKLSFSNAHLTNPSGAVICNKSSVNVFVTSVDKTTNDLKDGASNAADGSNENASACIASKGRLIFNGKGTLKVTGSYLHGIESEKAVRFRRDCDIVIESAESDGIHARDEVIIGSGLMHITALNNGIKSEGTISMSGGFVKIRTVGDKGSGLNAASGIAISSGAIQAEVKGDASYGVFCGGGFSMSGGKATLLVSGGMENSDSSLNPSVGIKCDGLQMSSGLLAIRNTGMAGKGISSVSPVYVSNGTMAVVAEGKSYMAGKLSSFSTGIESAQNIGISGGIINVRVTGGHGSEGISSKGMLQVSGGTIASITYGNSIRVGGAGFSMSGGHVYCYSFADSGIKSDSALSVVGGTLISSGSDASEFGFDCKGAFSIIAGTVLGVGGKFTDASFIQPWIVGVGEDIAKGTIRNIRFTDKDEDILNYMIPRNYDQLHLLYSSNKITHSANYSQQTIDTPPENGNEFYGMYLIDTEY